MNIQKGWTPFNISTLIELQPYQLVSSQEFCPSNFNRESETKKTRTCFSRSQVAVLEERFKAQKYITQTERTQLAEQLSMTDNQVKTWFQNRRTKWRRQKSDESFNHPTADIEKYFEFVQPH